MTVEEYRKNTKVVIIANTITFFVVEKVSFAELKIKQ